MKKSIKIQYILSVSLILITALIGFYTSPYIGYRVVALILLLELSILAMIYDILPVLVTSVLSAIIWNFFFIPPIFNFSIGTTEDILLFLMYFFVALINTVLTFKIKQYEKKVRDRVEREKTLKLYDTIISSLSHELRTPIAAIIGSIDTIQENKDKLDSESVDELLSEIETASIRLNGQVENLLNMSRLESGFIKTKSDWTDLNEIVFSAIDLFSTIKTHKIQFESNELLPLYYVDYGLIEQIIHNIIKNATLYTPTSTSVFIRLNANEEGFTLEIEDEGSGFPEMELEKVFEKFYRLPNSKAGGTGLGLSIVKGFVEALNGKVKIQNVKGGGALFTIDIPAKSSSLNKIIDHE